MLEPVATTIAGYPVRITRPTITDLVEAIQHQETSPATGKAFALWRHLHDPEGKPLFANIDEAKRCPAHIAAEAVVRIERLYNEGLE